MPPKAPNQAAPLPDSYPHASNVDKAITVARTGIAAIPILGGPIGEFMSLFGSPLERRREEAFELILAAVREAQQRKPDFDPTDPPFVSAVLHVCRASVTTHQAEKREYFRNALLHIATGTNADADKQQVFLAAIESMTVTHVVILDVLWRGRLELHARGLWSPPGGSGDRFSRCGAAITALHPNIDAQLVTGILMDLFSKGFSMVRTADDHFPQSPAVTNLGIEFLNFIRADVAVREQP